MPSDNAPSASERRFRVTISFRKSSSQYFDDALQIARELANYSVSGEGREATHTVDVELRFNDLQLWEQVRQLAQMVGGWKSTRTAVSGLSVATFAELEKKVARVLQCLADREQSGIGDLYCSGRSAPNDEAACFGCRFVTGVSRQLNGYYPRSYWYQFGELSADLRTFTVDTAKILEVCKARVGDDLSTDCPAFSWGRVWEDIEGLPRVLNLDDSSHFQISYSTIDPSKPIGVAHRKSGPGHGLALLLGADRDAEADGVTKRSVPCVHYAEIAGQDAALAEIRNVVELPLAHPEYFAEIGIEPQRGVVLYGPPGNGKTLIAKAVATESNAHLEVVNGPEVLSKWVGESEANLRGIFERAQRLQPSVVLIDELDAISPRRELMTEQHDIRLISQLLVLLDGLSARGRVAVIGTTNRIDALDPAILRPGRFDYHIEVALPDARGREAILGVHLQRMKTGPGVSPPRVAGETEGLSGAELAALCREAGLVAIHRGLTADIPSAELAVTQDDVEVALYSMRQKRVGSAPD